MRNFLYPISQLFPLRLLIYLTGQKLILPSYHLVSDEDVPHIKHLYPVRDTITFKKDIEYLLKYYEPLSLNDIKEIITGDKILTKPSFYLTFDDGLKQISELVTPILNQYGLTATFFLNSAFIDNRDLMFRYKASLIIDSLINQKHSRATIQKAYELVNANEITIQSISASIKNVKYNHAYLLDQIAGILQIDFNEFLKNYKPYLEREQLNKLIAEGFTIGAHSIDHPEYRYISKEEQIRQTQESIQRVNEYFKPAIKTFAFPFNDTSVSKSFFETIFNKKIIDLSFGGAGLKKDSFKNHLQRIPMERTTYSAEKVLKGEYLYYLLKAPLGKNYIRRR